MAGVNPGDKLTAALLNDNFMCRTEDTGSTGSISTDTFFIEGKRDEDALDSNDLVADVGVILLTQAATFPSSNPTAATLTAGLNGQKISIINCSGVDYDLNFLTSPVTLSDGQGTTLFYCTQKSEWFPMGGGGSGGGSSATGDVCESAHYRTAEQTILNETQTNVDWSVAVDTGPHVTVSGGDITINEPGCYIFDAGIFMSNTENNIGTLEIRLLVKVNGVAVFRFQEGATEDEYITSGHSVAVRPSFTKALAAGDVVTFEITPAGPALTDSFLDNDTATGLNNFLTITKITPTL